MKKKLSKIGFYMFMALAMTTVVVSCGNDDNDNAGDNVDPNGYELKGDLADARTLLAGETYTLVGGYHVKNGGNLIIEEGVTIKATRSLRLYLDRARW